MTNAFGYFPSMRRLVTRSSAEQCPVIKIVVTRDARVDNESRDSPEGGVKLDSFNIIYCIDHLHNGDVHLNKPSWPHSGAKILFNYRHRNEEKKAY